MTDIVERLHDASRFTEAIEPDQLSELCRDAIAEIMRLRTTVEHLQGVAGIATAGGQSFADIRAGIKPHSA